MNIYLVGYRGTGKTAVGQLLGDRLFWKWIDTDQWIQVRAGVTIAEIFKNNGQDAFRDLETDAVKYVAGLTNHIVSLGGGAILRSENRELIRNSGKTIWLRADAETIARRLNSDEASQSQRPKLTDQSSLDEIRQLLEQRHPFYAELADLELDTVEHSPEQVASQIADWLRKNRFAEDTADH